MQSNIPSWLHNLLPAKPTVTLSEQLRASAGALAALALAAGISMLWLGDAAVWLIAPMGASAVLLFCLPGSPLAQPWPVIAGNCVSALVGVACAGMGDPQFAELNTTTLEGRSLSFSELRHHADAIPFLSDKRMVLVDNFAKLHEKHW